MENIELEKQCERITKRGKEKSSYVFFFAEGNSYAINFKSTVFCSQLTLVFTHVQHSVSPYHLTSIAVNQRQLNL